MNTDSDSDSELDPEYHATQLITHWNEYLVSAFLGLPNTDITHLLFDSASDTDTEPSNSIIGHVHYLEATATATEATEVTEEQGPAKRPHLEEKEQEQQEQQQSIPSIRIKRSIVRHRYLKLLSGATFHFSDDDGKDILTTPTQEPNLYIRKLLSQLPTGVKDRLAFLAMFQDDSLNEVVEADLNETDEWIVPTPADLDPLSYLFTNLREQLYTAYLREMRMRRAFRILLQRWRIRRVDKKGHAVTDPITLIAPVKPVTVYDFRSMARYVYDATSLASWIESNLMYYEGGFALPMSPRNPWTNAEFTHTQLISIYEQLREHGELRWGLTTLRAYQFDRERWKLFHGSTLTLSAIRMSLTRLDSTDARELLEDFIYAKMEDLHIYTSPGVRTVYRKAILHAPHHWYLEEFKAVAYYHYEAQHFNQDRRRHIHNRCDRIFEKQDIFIEEIQRMGILSSRHT